MLGNIVSICQYSFVCANLTGYSARAQWKNNQGQAYGLYWNTHKHKHTSTHTHTFVLRWRRGSSRQVLHKQSNRPIKEARRRLCGFVWNFKESFAKRLGVNTFIIPPPLYLSDLLPSILGKGREVTQVSDNAVNTVWQLSQSSFCLRENGDCVFCVCMCACVTWDLQMVAHIKALHSGWFSYTCT